MLRKRPAQRDLQDPFVPKLARYASAAIRKRRYAREHLHALQTR